MMKTKLSSFSVQVMILLLAGVVIMVMISAAQAQVSASPSIAQANQGGLQNQAQVLTQDMPQRGLGQRIMENTSLTYYQQFLGPTAAGDGNQTYNVFQEGIDSPGSGRAPLQSFHAVNLRYQMNTDWAIGATLSAVNGYTGEVANKDRSGSTFYNNGELTFFNTRAYVSLAPVKLTSGTFFTTISYEAATSNISKENDMRWGWVYAQSFAFNLPDIRWNAGFVGQIYRIYYKNNIQPAPFIGARTTPMQTMIVSGGPYVNYRFNDHWMLGSVVTFDWDQRGVQTSSTNFNNNLSDRARLTLNYFPQKIKYIQSVGLFSQALLKFRPQTTAIGADLLMRF
jgi:hypothetical protein